MISFAKYCFCHVGCRPFPPCSAHTSRVYSLRQGYKLMCFFCGSLLLGAGKGGGVKKGKKGGSGRGPIKIQMSDCRCNSIQP